MSNPNSYSDLGLYRRLLLIARPYWLHIAGFLLLSLLSTPLALLGPLPLKIAIDSAIGDHPLPGFIGWLLSTFIGDSKTAVLIFASTFAVLLAFLQRLQGLSSSLVRAYVGEKLVLGFRALLFRHVQRLSLAFHDSQGTADSIYRINSDAAAIEKIAIDGVIPFITSIVTFASMLYITMRISSELVVVALAISPFLFLSARIYRRGLRTQSREVKKLESSALSVVQEVLTVLRVVKAFAQEDREQDRFVRRSSESMRARLRMAVTQGRLSILMGLTSASGTAAVLFVGVQNVQAGLLTVGELLIVMSYISKLYEPLKTFGRKVTSMQSTLVSAERAFALLDQEPDVTERPDARPLIRAKGAVEFRDVSFSYDDKHSVLRNISFSIQTGTSLGIAGPTGAGKTTLVSLLSRFYDPTHGQILLDGVDLREYRLADLRNQFAIVLQEPVLFSTSIAENIAYARPGATESEIAEAAKAANAHEFIKGLPEGYNTRVGERGMRLSGGERQRIGLARAFLKNASILILDEPTSSVDMKTEVEIMEAMDRLMGNRTTIMIAHRLSTLEHCDVLLVIVDGHIVTATSDVSTAIKNGLAVDSIETLAVAERTDTGA
jgi:ATP-binding cassette subfamily B protein